MSRRILLDIKGDFAYIYAGAETPSNCRRHCLKLSLSVLAPASKFGSKMPQNPNVLIRLTVVVITLLGIQFVLGKKASFPYGILMGLPLYAIGLIVILSDLFLIYFTHVLITRTVRMKWLVILQRRAFIDGEKLRKSRWLRHFQNLGRLGVVVVVSTPLAGGVWTGSILSRILGLERMETFALIAIGSVIGCAIFVFGFQGLLSWLT